jgi:hypothetical protein
MSDKKKLTEEELNSLQVSITKLNESKMLLGEVTSQAYAVQLQVLELADAFRKVQNSLEEKYGSINIDVSTGEYEPAAEEVE